MLYDLGNIKLYVVENYDELSRTGAEIVSDLIKKQELKKLGLATGSTPIGLYKNLIEMYNAGELDFSEITSFNLDEYYPIKRNDEQSYFHFMKLNLFDKINIKDENINIPNGEAYEINQECTDYENKLKQAGYVDLQILGIGNNGHIAFNEPDEIFAPFTHLVELDKSTIEANARFFIREEDVPKRAITMGIRSIMMSKRIILLANGASKANIIKEALFGTITPKVPASILQVHKDVSVIVTKEAAENMKDIISL